MSFPHIVITYFITLVIFLGIDSIWLTLAAPKIYRRYIGHLLAERPNLLAAGAFYALFIGGLLYFIIDPAIRASSLHYAVTHGAVFGLVTYATFDLTSQSVFKKWPTVMTLIDMGWGLVLSTSVSAISYTAVHALLSTG